MAQKYDDVLFSLCTHAQWSPVNEANLLEPYAYTTANPGKGIRSAMIDSFDAWLAVDHDNLKIIKKVVGMLHSASLMVDDIEDDSQLRRGEPVAHKIFGVPQVLNTANYVYFLAYAELAKFKDTHIVPNGTRNGYHEPSWARTGHLQSIVTEELLNLHRGQGLELLWRDSLQCPTEEEYIQMVNGKTGGLFRLAVRLMMACATQNQDVDYIPLVNLTGVFFQIRDDYMNLQNSEYEVNKGFAEDISEGKFSFPIIHGIRANPYDNQIMNVLRKRPSTPTLKVHAINYLDRQTRSFEYTYDVLERLESQIRAELARLGGNKCFEAIIDALSVRRK